MSIEMIPFSLRTAVFSVLKTLCVKASEQTLDLVWHLDPNVPDQVIGDPLRLRQVCLKRVLLQVVLTVALAYTIGDNQSGWECNQIHAKG